MPTERCVAESIARRPDRPLAAPPAGPPKRVYRPRCMGEIPNLWLRLQNRPENVMLVRQALSGVADGLGLDAIESNDLNTAVTEACNNVVSHAYGGKRGPLEVDVYVLHEALAVTVRDHGVGMRDFSDQHPPERTLKGTGELDVGDNAGPGGIGLPVIHALARNVQLGAVPGGGTEVRIELAAPKAAALEWLGEHTPSLQSSDDRHGEDLASTVELKVAPRALARAVLPRLLSALAARAYFSSDRISDVRQIADALAANADESRNGAYLEVTATSAPHDIELRIGETLELHLPDRR